MVWRGGHRMKRPVLWVASCPSLTPPWARITKRPVSAESRADFIHKLAIAIKEADESLFWLRFIQRPDFITGEKKEAPKSFCKDCHDILLIFPASIRTARENASADAEARHPSAPANWSQPHSPNEQIILYDTLMD